MYFFSPNVFQSRFQNIMKMHFSEIYIKGVSFNLTLKIKNFKSFFKERNNFITYLFIILNLCLEFPLLTMKIKILSNSFQATEEI